MAAARLLHREIKTAMPLQPITLTPSAKTPEDQLREILKEAVRLANDHQTRLTGGKPTAIPMEDIYEIVDSAEIVFGIWHDPTARYGVGYHVLKGVEHLQVMTATGKERSLTFNAVPCPDGDHASALEILYAQRTQTKQ